MPEKSEKAKEMISKKELEKAKEAKKERRKNG